ncbi:MAG: hypothetical protein LQ349_002123 [Xanthoria aureola]|nr:MAG: hypothetical protein LQ349_002123 [Xanthoria aureola]
MDLFRLVALLYIVAIAAGQQNTSDICLQAASRLPGRISYPTDSLYISSRQSYYSGFERALAPGCIFRPINTAEVSRFIKLVTAGGQYGNTSQVPTFAVRGGGHTLFSGAANIDGGVTIDLREIKSVVLSKDRKMAAVGGGAVWSDIYPQMVPYNLTVMGGRVPGVGVGGFVTGGGVNFLNQRYGWSCDNIYGYEVVLASGEVVYATANSYQDLWLALKGGSNNFGIVTRFDVATFPQGLMWGGVISFNYTKSVLEAQAKAFRDYMDPKNFDSAADMGIILNYANNTFSVSNSLFYVDPVPYPKTYKAFTSIPSLSPNTLALTNVSNMVVQFGKNLPTKVARSVQLVYSFKNTDVATYTKLIQQWETDIKTLGNVPGYLSQFLIQPQPVTNGTNSMGLEANQHDVVMCIVTAAWTNPADDARVQQLVTSIVDKHERVVRKQRLYIPFKYLNYADISQDVIGSYGTNNKRRLRAVSRKYDPKALFQTSVPGGFKVSK